ncbi:stress protein [Kribbella antibiotica]|uniref:Stress protein n=1 Tax=Kribbella antibiotica TaxID=190195 RepID=A0A4R4ZVN1_9ACTN|nr:stress protein [Kribbella antibiotica]TDD63233.1 stress protein [Kribbella antibiotica]
MRTTYQRLMALLMAGAASAAVLVPATAAQAAPAAAPVASIAAAPAATAADPGPRVEVIAASVNITKQLIKLIDGAIRANQNRAGYVKSLSEAAFHEADGQYNVMVINDANRRVWSLSDVVYEAKASGHHGTYHIFVFKAGFIRNEGDGGYINWAYQGWWNRDGKTVNFHRP